MRWYQRLFRRARTERRLDAELRFHLEQQIADYIASGMTPEEARRRARLEFGGLDQVKEECRDVGAARFVESLIQDVHYGLRQLRRNPGFTAVAIITLALGLAATAAVFSVINGVLLQPLGYADAGQLVAIQLLIPKLARQYPMIPVNALVYSAWSRRAKSLAGMGLVQEGLSLNLTGAGEPALLNADAVTSGLFSVLGVRPRLGRNFLPDADQAGHGPEAVLTNRLWRSRFHGDPRILGHPIVLNRKPYTVVGILPASFQFPQGNQLIPMIGFKPKPELFVPLVFSKGQLTFAGEFNYAGIGRLKPGVSRTQAVAELNTILNRLPNEMSVFPGTKAVMMPLREMVVRSSQRALWVLLAAVLAVVLIICVSLAGLMLARATAREHEAAIRRALGASRGRLLRQSLSEALLLGLLGGALGLALAQWGLQVLRVVAPTGLPRLDNIRLDGPVLGFTLVISILAGVLAGLLPARRMAEANPQDALRSGDPRTADSRSPLRARALLVGAETALSVVLLIASGLLLASFRNLYYVPKGFAVQQILVVHLHLPQEQYTRTQERIQFWRNVVTATSALPGVDSSALIDVGPLGGTYNYAPITVPGDTRPIPQRPQANYRRVSPALFKLLEIPLLRGRELTWADAGKHVVLISAATAREVWPGRNAIGRTFCCSSHGGAVRVVGVVGDTRSISLSKARGPMVYQPFDGKYESGLRSELLLRTRLPTTAVAPELRHAIWRIDPSLAVPRVRSMNQIVSASLAPRRFETCLISLFGAAALLLACLGIYGVVSYSVLRRTHEIGIRMALGAQKANVLRLVVGQGMMPALLGVGAGVIGAAALTRFLSSLLFEIKPADPLTFIGVALILLGVALLACYIPARRAARIDPMVALRHE